MEEDDQLDKSERRHVERVGQGGWMKRDNREKSYITDIEGEKTL